MSHKTTVQVEVKDLKTLKKCLSDMGFTFEASVDGKNSLRTESTYTNANDDVCLKLTGYTDGRTDKSVSAIGFRQEKDGAIKATGDFWRVKDISGKHVTADRLGKQIRTRYTIHKVMGEMQKQGFRATSNKKGVAEKGLIRIGFTSMGGM